MFWVSKHVLNCWYGKHTNGSSETSYIKIISCFHLTCRKAHQAHKCNNYQLYNRKPKSKFEDSNNYIGKTACYKAYRYDICFFKSCSPNHPKFLKGELIINKNILFKVYKSCYWNGNTPGNISMTVFMYILAIASNSNCIVFILLMTGSQIKSVNRAWENCESIVYVFFFK